jgi:tRNA dimethylallyltransferase
MSGKVVPPEGKSMSDRVEAVLIAGPTASGKSALALELAKRIGGTIVNADSKQVYRDLRILSARPSAAEEAIVPHLLYGHIDAAVNYSVAAFLGEAAAALAETRGKATIPVFVGGTGLYFKAMTRGLSRVPPVPAEIRHAVRERLEREGPAVLHAELARCDALVAARLNPADRVRIARALEVVTATGRSIDAWNRDNSQPLIDPARAVKLFLTPERKDLYARIHARFDTMLAAGALEEVRALGERHLDPLLPAMKAHGVPWLLKHLAGEIGLQEASEHACRDTRHYAKRQFTWFRHQLADWTFVAPEAGLDLLLHVMPS